MNDANDFTCSVGQAGAQQRAPQLRKLAAAVRSHEAAELRARFEFPLESEPLVHEFVRDESACCAFFGFDVTERDRSVILDVTTPQGGQPMLAALVELLTTGELRSDVRFRS